MTLRVAMLLMVVARVASAQPAQPVQPAQPAQPAQPGQPALTVDSALTIADLLQPEAADHEATLIQLIDNTPDSEAEEKSEYLFRLGRFYAARFHAAKQKDTLLKTVKTFKTLVDNDAFRNYPKLDVALFYYGYTLQTGAYMKEARAVYDKLLKTYPSSSYVPEAHLAFADYYFAQVQFADAEARYRMVLKFPKSRAYWYAMYKMGWIHLDLQRFQEALETFFQTAQATKNDKTLEALHREATKDFVRAYAGIGKPEHAYAAFRRVDAALAKDMLELSADLAIAQSKRDIAATQYRELVKLEPTKPDACRWQTKLAGAVTGTPVESYETRVLLSMKQCAAVVTPAQQQQVAGAILQHALGAMPSDVVLTAPPKVVPLAEPIPADELATIAELDRVVDTLPVEDNLRAKLVEAAIYRTHAHHDEAAALLANIVDRHHDQPLAELAADLWLDSLIQLHRFDAALEVVDRLANDKTFIADKPTLKRNVTFLRSRSLR